MTKMTEENIECLQAYEKLEKPYRKSIIEDSKICKEIYNNLNELNEIELAVIKHKVDFILGDFKLDGIAKGIKK